MPNDLEEELMETCVNCWREKEVETGEYIEVRGEIGLVAVDFHCGDCLLAAELVREVA